MRLITPATTLCVLLLGNACGTQPTKQDPTSGEPTTTAPAETATPAGAPSVDAGGDSHVTASAEADKWAAQRAETEKAVAEMKAEQAAAAAREAEETATDRANVAQYKQLLSHLHLGETSTTMDPEVRHLLTTIGVESTHAFYTDESWTVEVTQQVRHTTNERLYCSVEYRNGVVTRIYTAVDDPTAVTPHLVTVVPSL